MTKQITIDRAVVEQALEVLDRAGSALGWQAIGQVERELRTALAEPDVDPCIDGSCDCCWTDKESQNKAEQPAEQEPVAYIWTNIQSGEIEVTWDEDAFSRAMWHRAPLYTAPKPAKPAERVPLTDREVGAIMEELNAYGTRLWEFARAIEHAHGIGVEK